jgi:hypothetical protein
MDETLLAALSAVEALEKAGARCFIGGSLASSLHGIPRATFDADIVADLRTEQVGPLIRALGDGWYADEETMRDAIANRASFNLIHLATAMKVDVFLPKLRRFDGGQFARALRMPVAEGSGMEAAICSAEDIIVAKLEWFKLGQETSERQWGDIMGVLKLNAGCLDLEAMRERSLELGVSGFLEKALSEACQVFR